jgi:hypothetical protein
MRVLPIQPEQPILEAPLYSARITGGMDSFIDPADLPENIGTNSINTRTFADYTFRAPGVVRQTGTNDPPNTKPVLLYTIYKRFDGSSVFLRFTEDRVDKYSSGTWTQLTGSLNGTVSDRFRFVTTADANSDHFFFTNNGVNKIKSLNASATSFSDLGNSDKYRYICVFFNRVVGANLAGSSPQPVQVAWSGDYNFTEWNPSNDISAGDTPLAEAQADYADPITGVFGFAQVMLFLRERSLWLATKRPVASAPFLFQAAFPYVGCDVPNSATQTRNGLVWYDSRTNQVFLYEVGQTPRPIGNPVRTLIKNAMENPDLVWGAYDLQNNTYFLTVPGVTTTKSRVFLFNFDTGSWSIDERENLYGVYPLDGGQDKKLYEQITGTYGQITGSYAALEAGASVEASNFMGYKNGKIGYESLQATRDEVMDTDIVMSWESKVYRLPKDDIMVSRLHILYQGIRPGSFTVWYRKNNGNWIEYRTVAVTDTQRRRTYFKKLIRANEYQWRVTSTNSSIKLLEYRIDVSASPEDK